MTDMIIITLLLGGSLLSLIAAIGLVKLPDVFTRMHASTKAGTLGIEFVMIALALNSGEMDVIIKAAAIVLFIVLTAPVAAHMLGRTAYRLGEDYAQHTVVDQWQDSMRKQAIECCDDMKEIESNTSTSSNDEGTLA